MIKLHESRQRNENVISSRFTLKVRFLVVRPYLLLFISLIASPLKIW